MARGNNANRTRANNPNANTQKKNNGVQRAQKIQQAIDRHWKSLPKEAQTFVLSSPNTITFDALVRFWSNQSLVDYTRGKVAGGVCGASLFMALSYMKLGRLDLARALTLTGAFILQCISTPIETLRKLRGPEFNVPVRDCQVPLFSAGFHAVRTPQTMEAYLEDKLPEDYQHMMESFAKTEARHVMSYVDEIADDWTGSATSARRYKKKSSMETVIQIILQDDANEDERCCLDIGSSTTLKKLFNDYAGKRGVSLRSLRFSFAGNTLFLSSIGNKTPEECNMRDQDVITVHKTSASVEECTRITKKNDSTQKKPKKSSKKTKGKRSQKKQTKQELPAVKTIEECKAQHSAVLSKLHEEVQGRLKEIRNRLNSLDLERMPPKQKKRNSKRSKTNACVAPQILPNSTCVGGKAGKTHFNVNVGEVQNLYKTTKPSSQKSSGIQSASLDLHGCTQEEALQRLDDILPVWVDTALRGSYPFVMPASIVCGCGNQILSETVETWIRDNARVANAPRSMIPRQ